MKNQRIQKNIGTLVATLVLVFSLFGGSLATAAPGDGSDIPLNAGNRAQGVSLFHIGNSNLTGPDLGFDAAELGKKSLFALTDNLMVIFGNLLIRGNTFIGKPNQFQAYDVSSGSTITLPVKRLNIAGTFHSSDLAYSTGEPEKKLCTDSAGIIQICSIAGSVCGNSAVEPGEQCDDGNTAGGDGCSATCQNEPFCGNGVVDAGEQCDDGNTANGDGCSSTCQTEVSYCPAVTNHATTINVNRSLSQSSTPLPAYGGWTYPAIPYNGSVTATRPCDSTYGTNSSGSVYRAQWSLWSTSGVQTATASCDGSGNVTFTGTSSACEPKPNQVYGCGGGSGGENTRCYAGQTCVFGNPYSSGSGSGTLDPADEGYLGGGSVFLAAETGGGGDTIGDEGGLEDGGGSGGGGGGGGSTSFYYCSPVNP